MGNNAVAQGGTAIGIEWDPDELVVDQVLSEWSFFLPEMQTVTRVLQLNETLGDYFLEKESQEILAREGAAFAPEENPEIIPGTLKRFFQQVSEILFHHEEESGEETRLSERESISYFQKLFSEKIYNHLAMLSRSPHAQKGKAFSIREELTAEIAEKIGLAAGLHPDASPTLKEQSRTVLNDLAYEFQKWLVGTQQGIYPTTWAIICTRNKEEVARQRGSELAIPQLILSPDVERSIDHLAYSTAEDESAEVVGTSG